MRGNLRSVLLRSVLHFDAAEFLQNNATVRSVFWNNPISIANEMNSKVTLLEIRLQRIVQFASYLRECVIRKDTVPLLKQLSLQSIPGVI